jgi:hypothetical protein
MLSNVIKAEIKADAFLETARAIAYLDRAGDYLKNRGIKDTSEARKQYVEIDDDVHAAIDLKAKATAMVTFLKNKLQTFRCAHDDIKKMVYADSYKTPNEGF